MFSIFKKKEQDSPVNKPKTVLCIPGNWNDSDEIVRALAASNPNEFIFAGMTLLDIENDITYEVEICESDEAMRDSFYWAGRINQLDEDFLDEIEQHQHVVYIIGETGDSESAEKIARAGNAFLKAGGMGMKVESTGKAFTKEHWNSLLNDDFDGESLYEMFVHGAIGNEGKLYSCGMHNLGLRDTIVYNEELQESADLIMTFNLTQLINKPELKKGMTFNVEDYAPLFVMTEEANQPNEGDELFENPYGMWKLTRKE